MSEYAPPAVSDAFMASRFDPEWGRTFGLLPRQVASAAIIDRAWPV